MTLFTEGTTTYSILDLGFSRTLIKLGPLDLGAITLDTPPEMANVFTGGIVARTIIAGELITDIEQQTGTLFNGKITFDNTDAGFILGVDNSDGLLKFYIGNTSSYLNWTGSALNIAGSITATSGAIGGFNIGSDYIRDVANSMGMASTVTGGDDVRFWAGDTFANRASAPFRVTEAGAVTGSSITITGGAISGVPISGIPNDTVTDIFLLEFSHDLVFSSSDADTVAWASGTITMSNGRTFSIDAGNTGDMTAITLIYLDTGVSSTVLQITTSPSTAVGANKILLAIAEDSTTGATFQVTKGIGGIGIDDTQIFIPNLAAINADLGSITAGSITVVGGGNTVSFTPASATILTSGPTGSPTFTVTAAGVMSATGVIITGNIFQTTTPIETYTPAADATATLDLSLGGDHRIQLPSSGTDNTIALSNETIGQRFIVSVTQHTVARTVTWFSTIRWTDGAEPILSSGGNKRDTFGFIVTGSGTYDGFILGLFI